jgi:hypothetical protein
VAAARITRERESALSHLRVRHSRSRDDEDNDDGNDGRGGAGQVIIGRPCIFGLLVAVLGNALEYHAGTAQRDPQRVTEGVRRTGGGGIGRPRGTAPGAIVSWTRVSH